MYGYTERRIAYFRPGPVSLVMEEDGRETTLFSRALESREILTLKVTTVPKASSSTGGRVRIQLDTSRVWSEAGCQIGGGSQRGADRSDAYGIEEAKAHVGEKGVWVRGYIVGGDLSSSSASFAGPFSSKTNLVIGPRASTREKASCLSVQLRQGDIRHVWPQRSRTAQAKSNQEQTPSSV